MNKAGPSRRHDPLRPHESEDPVVTEVREFRKAARMIVRAERGSLREKLAGLMRLGDRARSSPAGQLAQRAIWIECKSFVRGEKPRRVPPSSDPVENAIRGLLAEQFIRCPRCRRPLPDERELDRWRRLREQAIGEARRFEEAVPK